MTNAVAMSFAVLVDWSYTGSGAPNFASTNADITAYIKDISVTSGIQDSMSGTAYVGTCTLRVENSSRRFSPAYTSGPLYGSLKPNKPIKVTVTSGATTWTLFRGWLTNVNPSSGQYGDRECTIEAKDILGRIQEELVGMPILSNVLSSTLLRHVVNYALKASVATALVTLTAVPSATNTLVLNDGSGAVTLTWVSTLTGAADQVKIGADIAECTQNLAAAINKGTGAADVYAGNITVPRTITALPVIGTEYPDSNYDTPVELQASAMTGESVTLASTPSMIVLGNWAGGNRRDGQTFTPGENGRLTSIGFYLGVAEGSPGAITITIQNTDWNGATIYTGQIASPLASNWNDHTLTQPVYLQASSVYFVTLSVATQAGVNDWVLYDTANNPYAGGCLYYSDNGGTWTAPTSGGLTFDMDMRYTTAAVTNRTKLAQSFQLPALRALGSLTLYLAKVGSPTGTATLRIETDSNGSPSGILADVNATTTLAESSLSGQLTNTAFVFASAPVLYPTTSYWLVLSTDRSASATDFIVWGADASSPGYTSGVMKSYGGASWNAESKDAIFSTGASTVTLVSVLHGAVGNSYTISKTGSWCSLSDSTFAGGVDEPADLAPALDTGLNTFQFAGDTWTAEGDAATNAMTCIEQITASENLSFFWIARDGRITWKNRTWFPLLSQATADLSLSSEHNAVTGAAGMDTLYNWIGANYTPPGTLASGVVAKSTSTIVVPGLTGLTERWNPTQVITTQVGSRIIKLPFTDPATGQAIGALSVITPLAPTTDYTAYEFADKTGWNYTTSPSLRFSVVVLGSGVEITVYNSAIGPLYIFDLQCRGVGLTHYQSTQSIAEDATSQATQGRRALSIDLPLVSNESYFPGQLVRYLLTRFTNTDYVLTSITFVNQNVVGSTNLFSLEYGDVLSITDAQTGLSTSKYVITGASYNGIGPGRSGSITFYVRWLDPTPLIVQGNLYAQSNQDADEPLSTQAPVTTTITASGDGAAVGNSGGINYHIAQSFQMASTGVVTQFTVKLGASTGSPTGTISWQITTDNSGLPNVIIKSGTFTPTASATNTVTVTSGPTLTANTPYWLILYATDGQASGNFWTWQDSSTSTYANGNVAYWNESIWQALSTYDAQCSVTIYTDLATKLAQSFQLSADAAVGGVKLYLKKAGTPTGTLTVRLETNSGSAPSGTLVDANATGILDESTLTTSYAPYTFVFPTSVTATGSTTYWIVLSTSRSPSPSNYVDWGVDSSTPSYANGNVATYTGTWSAVTGEDACFELVITDKIFYETVG